MHYFLDNGGRLRLRLGDIAQIGEGNRISFETLPVLLYIVWYIDRNMISYTWQRIRRISIVHQRERAEKGTEGREGAVDRPNSSPGMM